MLFFSCFCLEIPFPSLLPPSQYWAQRQWSCCHILNCFPCCMYSTQKKCVQSFLMVRMQYSCAASLFQVYFPLYQTYWNAHFRSACGTSFFFPWKNPIPKYLKSTVINFTITQILKKKIIRPPTSQSSMEEIQLMWQPSQWRQPLVKRKHPIDNAEDISTFSSFSSVSTVGEQLFCIRPKILQPLTYLLWQRSYLLCLFRDYAVHSISELFLSRSLPSPILAPRDCCELRTSA